MTSTSRSSSSASRRLSGRVPVIAGTGSNSTAEAIELTRHAKEAGADGVLVVTPYYNKPTQEGLYLHYKAINDCADIPIIIYNIPGRSVVDMSVDTMARLFKLSNIVGVKDATANMARVSQQRAAMGTDFIQLSGEDATALGFMAHGGTGLHLGHRQCRARALFRVPARVPGRQFQARAPAPGPADAAARRAVRGIQSRPGEICRGKLGLSNGETRLPLAPIAAASRKRVDDALAAVGLALV